MVYNLFLFLGFFLFVFLAHTEGKQPYDPSTVINVYPSLANLNSKGAKPKSSYDMDADYCLDESCAASNVEPNWANKNSEKPSKPVSEPEEPILPKSERLEHKHHVIKDIKKLKAISKSPFLKAETGMNSHSSTPSVSTKSILLLPEVTLKPETSYQPKQPHDNNNDEWNKVHNWSSFQDMLQLLRKRKH